MAPQRLALVPASITNAEVRSKLEEVRRLVESGLVKAEVYELLLAQQHHHGGALEEVAPIPASIIDVDLRSKLEEVRSLVANGLVKAEIYELLLAQQQQSTEVEGLTPIPASIIDVEVRSRLEEVQSLVECGLVKAEVYELLLAQQHQHGSAPPGGELAPIPASITNAEVRKKLEEVRRLVESGLVKAEVYELLLAQLRQHGGAPEEGLTPIPASMTDVEVRSKLEEVQSLVASGLVKAEIYELLLAQQLKQQHDSAFEELTPIPTSIIDLEVRNRLEEVRSLVECGLVKAEVYELLLTQQHQHDEGPSLYSNFTYYTCEKSGHLVPACVM